MLSKRMDGDFSIRWAVSSFGSPCLRHRAIKLSMTTRMTMTIVRFIMKDGDLHQRNEILYAMQDIFCNVIEGACGFHIGKTIYGAAASRCRCKPLIAMLLFRCAARYAATCCRRLFRCAARYAAARCRRCRCWGSSRVALSRFVMVVLQASEVLPQIEHVMLKKWLSACCQLVPPP